MPEIGLNGLLLDYPHSGTAVYIRNLVPLLSTVAPDLDFRLFVRHTGLPGVREERLTTPFAPLNHGRGPGAQLDKFSWETVVLPLAAAARRQSLLHSLYFAAPPAAPCPLVVTVHDLITLILPGYYRSRQSALYSAFMARTVKRAAAVITVSEHSRRDIVRTLGVPASRVHVTYEAVDDRFRPQGDPQVDPTERSALRSRYDLPQRFLLYVGSAERRKNIPTLVRAWARVAREMRRREVRLVIVAAFPPPDRLYPDVPGLARGLGLDDVIFLPSVAEADKPALYRAALAFCFPSMYEGFGFPPLEAMACGVPVIASNASSIPEVVGEGSVLLPAEDDAAWAETMLELVDSEPEQRRLRQRGLAQAERFSWRQTAEETVAVYRSVLR